VKNEKIKKISIFVFIAFFSSVNNIQEPMDHDDQFESAEPKTLESNGTGADEEEVFADGLSPWPQGKPPKSVSTGSFFSTPTGTASMSIFTTTPDSQNGRLFPTPGSSIGRTPMLNKKRLTVSTRISMNE
jgi:hypothetical protein